MKHHLMRGTRLQRFVIGLLLAAVAMPGGLASCAADSEVEPTAPPVGGNPTGETSWPQRQADCQRVGGRWEQLGIVGLGCNMPTRDGGKRCNTGKSCEGFCLAADPQTMKEDGSGTWTPDEEYMERVNQSGWDSEGACSAWKTKFGCFVVVESGRLLEICVD